MLPLQCSTDIASKIFKMDRIKARNVSRLTFFVEKIFPVKLEASFALAIFITDSSKVTILIFVLARSERNLLMNLDP